MPRRSASCWSGSELASSVVAMTISSRCRQRRRRSTISSSSGLPRAGSSTLPGRREEVMRASIVATTRSMRCTVLSGAVAIPYGRQSITEEDIEAVVAVLRSERLTQGPALAAFEQEFASAVDAPFAVAFSSGTAALHAAAWAAGLGPGDELLTSAITFAASANCAAYVGATPRFADIDPDTWNVSPATVAAALTDATRAVIPVHFTGLPLPMAEIRAAIGPDRILIEDAAHAVGAFAGDEIVGSCRHSDMAIFSFHPVKGITSGEGGMVTTRSAELRDRLALFRTHGIARPSDSSEGAWFQEQLELGFNYRLTDIQAALASSQLRRLED